MNEMDCQEGSTMDNCEIKAFERNKYFYGKLMTVLDFETEQRYFNSKRSMLNRLIHGMGLVCGLKVSEPEIVNQKLKVKLSQGVALDCCGHEIVIEDTGVLHDVEGTPADGTNYIYLKYRECLRGKSPAMSNPSSCEETCCYGRVLEGFRLEVSQQAPPAEEAMNWAEIWQQREQDIKDLADELGIGDPLGLLVAKLSVSADAYLEKVECGPTCDDPKVLLAVANITGSNIDLDSVKDETLALRSLVYNNPMLYELLKSHLTDLANPHQVTAEQTGALVSVDGVKNPGGDVDLVAENAITIQSDDAGNRITIGEDHSTDQDNPHKVTAEQTGALVSVNGVGNPGGNIDLVEGDNVSIEPDDAANTIKISATGGIASIEGVSNPGGNIDLVAGENINIVPDDAANTITISAAGANVANTGILPVTIAAATADQPGNTLIRGILHGLDTKLSPAIILGLATPGGVIMESDFITQRQIIELMSKLYDLPAPPPVYFKALAVTNSTFDVLAVNMNLDAAVNINIAWWAVPATKRIGRIDIGRVAVDIRERVGADAVNALATERNIADSEVNLAIGEIINTVNAQPSGITMAGISRSTGTTTATTQPIIEAMVEAGVLEARGTGTRRTFTMRQ